MVRMPRRSDRVHSNLDVAVGTVLEADRTRQPGSERALNLTFGRARADGAPGHEIRDVLRRDRVEVLDAGRQAELVDLAKQAAAETQTLVDVEAAVEVGIVDEPLPADGRARLLEVHAHDELERVAVRVAKRSQESRVLE